MVGAILTQNTNWHNVERTMTQLRAAGALHAKRLARLPRSLLQRLVWSSGFFKQKAARLQGFSRWYCATYGARPYRMFRTNPSVLRGELLKVPGIGPETADSILLYAGNQPVFVVGAYTRRIFTRHLLIEGHESYAEIQQFVMDRLPENPKVFNEMHALLVAVGKDYCHRQKPDCMHCPLGDFPHTLQRGVHG